jgi:hypothetical protein
MKNNLRYLFSLTFVVITALSCQTQQSASEKTQQLIIEPSPTSEVEPVIEPATVEMEPAIEVIEAKDETYFDPTSISKEVFDATKGEVQALIEELNQLIRDKNYTAWVQYLSPGYKESLSNPEFLKTVSESSRLKNQKIVLKNLEDYFLYVVVPSRANDRVDDIEFIGQNRVKAYTITSKGQRLRLYELEKTDGNWNIVN